MEDDYGAYIGNTIGKNPIMSPCHHGKLADSQLPNACHMNRLMLVKCWLSTQELL